MGCLKIFWVKGQKNTGRGGGIQRPPPHMGERVKHTNKVCNITNYNFLNEKTTLHLKIVNVTIGQAKKMVTAFSD